ncbi:MAG: tetratricopeptide repeat protein, partial [Flavobacteriales bacterium]|nr:tetratricopeptide repeat protein [Flavobacteriales bacterium]
MRTSTLLLSALLSIMLSAQTSQDSLWNIWQDGSQSDSSRVKALSIFIWEGVMFSDADSAVQLSDAMIDFAEQQNYLEGLIQGHHCKGSAYDIQGNYIKAAEHYEKSIAFAEKAGDLQGSATTFNGWAGVMDNLGQNEKAMELYERSLAISTEAGDTSCIAAVLQNIGGLYKDQGNLVLAMDMMKKSAAMKEAAGLDRSLVYSLFGIAGIYHNQQDFDPALEYYQRALKISKELDDRAKVAFCLGNMGVMFFDQGKLTEALDYLEQAKAMNTEVGRRKYVADNLFNMGRVSEAQGNFTEALDLYQQALDIQQEIDQKRGIAGTVITMGGLFQKQENTVSALKYCHQGLQLAVEIDAVFWEQMACECLYQTYKIEGKDNKALEYHERMIVARDSLYNEKNTKEITQLEMRYDFEKKEAAIKADQEKKDAVAAQELRRQKLVRNGFMGGFALVAVFAGIFFTQRNRIGKEKARSEELLLNILPEEVADELKAKGEAEAKLIDQVTVLFTDFKGFTAMSETLSPKELVRDLHECFSAFDHICQEHGLEK